MFTQVKTKIQIEAMREGGHMLAAVLKVVGAKVTPGVSTKELADYAARELKALGGKPAFLGYQGFPDVICISVNDEIVHGIPSKDRLLQTGDVVGLDFGVTCRGYITDGAISVGVGTLAAQDATLLDVTKKSLDAGIAAVHDRVRVGDISEAIESSIRRGGKYGIPRELVGHGVGTELWEGPNVPNHGRADSGPWLDKHMTVAIEPMVTLGTDHITLDDDGWTVHTADGSKAAHFEHTVLILENRAEILTQ